MQVIEGGVEEMSGSELLDHVDLLEASRRRVDVETLRAAVQHAILHNADTVDPKVSRLGGRERAVRFGGPGTPKVAEFAGAVFGARLKVSDHAGKQWIADGLDLLHRLPRLWARVQALEVKVSYARFVAQKTRELSLAQALYVDGRVAGSADGRIAWSRFELLVAGAVAAADPEAAAARERAAAEEQFARKTRSQDNGIGGFYIQAHFAVIARLEASVAFLAEALRVMGDDASLDARRVKAVLILANPIQATEFLVAYQGWKDRPADPDMPADEHAAPPPAEGEPRGGAGTSDQHDERSGEKPSIDWGKLLPTMVLYLHMYRSQDSQDGQTGQGGQTGRGGTGIVRVEGVGPVTEDWVRRFLGPDARFKIGPVIDLEGQAPVDAYEVPDRHRQAVHLMTPADIFPFSPNLTRDKQVDHTERYVPGAAGQSRVGNYGPMTTFHHRIKTHGTWQVKQPFPGIYVWRDEHGAFFLVDHTGTRRVNGPGSPSQRAAQESLRRCEHAAYLASIGWTLAA